MKKNTKKILALLLVFILGTLILAGCGNNNSVGGNSKDDDDKVKLSGKYTLVSLKDRYGDEYDEYDIEEMGQIAYIEFLSGGKYRMSSEGYSAEGKFKISGNTVTIYPPEERDGEALKGKINGKKLTLEQDGMTMIFEKKSDSSARSNDKQQNQNNSSKLSGKYLAYEMTQDGEIIKWTDYVKEIKEMYDEYEMKYSDSDFAFYLEFLKDGKCKMVFMGDSEEGTFKVDGKNISITFDGETQTGKINGNKIIIEADDVKVVFQK